MNARRATRAAIAATAFCVLQAHAQEAESPVRTVMKRLGFAADPPPAADFVVKSRPKTESDYIPVFQAPPEPARRILGEQDLGRLKGDLDSVQKRHDSVRQAFPPSAKAVAEQKAQQEAAKRAKAKAAAPPPPAAQ